MKKAFALARRGEGGTRPNPPVGAVVVRAGIEVGSGFHRKAGRPHAELLALRQAGARARGATLYVTLEPCSTYGRTPPCTDAIRRSGVARVVFSVRDPNPRHHGKGGGKLRRAGILVKEGICSEEGGRLVQPFSKWINTGMPFVTLKMAMTLDGKIADASGRSRWITSTLSRKEVHRMRRSADAILVGGGTVRKDDPSLCCAGHSDLRRIVVDSAIRFSLDAAVLSDGNQRRTVVATTTKSPVWRRRQCEHSGAEVWVLPSMNGKVSLRSLMRRIGQRGWMHVLCEGGAEIARELIRQRLVDRFVFFLAPRFMGGGGTLDAIAAPGWRLSQTPWVCFAGVNVLGKDIVIHATPEGGRRERSSGRKAV